MVPMTGFATPEDAALAGSQPAHCRIVAVARDGADAYVLLDTGSPGRAYLYGVVCRNDGDGWQEMMSSNGGGWSLTDEKTGLGVHTLWDEVPADADQVRIEFRGESSEHPIAGGLYFFAWFNQPIGAERRVAAIRVAGQWVGQFNGLSPMLWTRS